MTFQLDKFHRDSPDYYRTRYALWLLTSAVFFTNAFNFMCPVRIKIIILKLFGANIGKSSIIKPGVKIKYPWKLKMGEAVWLGENVWIENIGSVIIGDNVCISQGVNLITGNHNFKSINFDLIEECIEIGDDVWIGCFNTILPGETVPQGTFIPANTTKGRWKSTK